MLNLHTTICHLSSNMATWSVIIGYLCVVQTVVGLPATVTVKPDGAENQNNFQVKSQNAKRSTPLIKVTEMEITSRISMRYSYTEVITHVENGAEAAEETTFNILLPETAFISGFVMTIDGKEYKAYVKAKAEAKEIYKDAVAQGLSAATVTAKARDSNRFTVSVNLEPKSSAVFNLTYEELLVRNNGVYNQVINLHPGGLVPKFTVNVHIKESQKITKLRVPEISSGNEIDTDQDQEYFGAVITRNRDDRQATITFKPDLKEQERLMKIYDKKIMELLSKSDIETLRRRRRNVAAEGALGQFVVQYDIFRPQDGEVLTNKGYFAQFLSAPDSVRPLNKYVVFVLDKSYSMKGQKLSQLKEAMKTIFAQLNEEDYFSLVDFSSKIRVHDISIEANPPAGCCFRAPNEEDPPKKVAPSQATPENIANAQTIIGWLKARGATNIAGALDIAGDLVRTGLDDIQNIDKNDYVKIIIFLTDGEPTIGELSTTTIIKSFSEKNGGGEIASLYTLGLGQEIDFEFLRKLAVNNNGIAKRIYESSDANKQLRKFFEQVSKPVLSNVNVGYSVDEVAIETVTKKNFKAIFTGEEKVVAGLLKGHSSEILPTLKYTSTGSGEAGKIRTEKYSKLLAHSKEQEVPLDRLWAYLRIRELLDERDLAEIYDKPSDGKQAEKKALELALQYGFVTPVTSLVVVKPGETNLVNAESLDNNKEEPTTEAPKKTSSTGQGWGQDVGQGMGQVSHHWGLGHGVFVNNNVAKSTESPLNRLENYNLVGFDWMIPLLVGGVDEIDLMDEFSTVQFLRLYKKSEIPITFPADAECSPSIHSGPGLCVYLTRCEPARNITAFHYANTFCIISDGYAGICCPQNYIEKEQTTPSAS